MRKYGVCLGVFVICLIILSGCTSSQPYSGPKDASPNGLNQQSPTATTTPQTIQQPVPLTGNQTPHKYVVGDIISTKPNEDTSAKIVFGYNPETKKYQLDTIYTNEQYKWGYRIYPDLETEGMNWVEDNYPYFISHIDISEVVTKYPSESARTATLHPTYTVTPTQTQSYSSYTNDEGSSSSKQCWVNGYYRKSGTYVNGYYRRC